MTLFTGHWNHSIASYFLYICVICIFINKYLIQNLLLKRCFVTISIVLYFSYQFKFKAYIHFQWKQRIFINKIQRAHESIRFFPVSSNPISESIVFVADFLVPNYISCFRKWISNFSIVITATFESFQREYIIIETFYAFRALCH